MDQQCGQPKNLRGNRIKKYRNVNTKLSEQSLKLGKVEKSFIGKIFS